MYTYKLLFTCTEKWAPSPFSACINAADPPHELSFFPFLSSERCDLSGDWCNQTLQWLRGCCFPGIAGFVRVSRSVRSCVCFWDSKEAPGHELGVQGLLQPLKSISPWDPQELLSQSTKTFLKSKLLQCGSGHKRCGVSAVVCVSRVHGWACGSIHWLQLARS